MTNTGDHGFMARALHLARRGLYSASPNPRVGCVLVRNDRIVGEGWHRRAGEAHAEIVALEDAGDQARNATAYVTLEPCCHQGRTPPCTAALIDAGVARVVAAMVDPHPSVSGGGFEALRRAGIDVQVGVLRKEAEGINPGFLSLARRGRPWIRVKLAVSLDGRTAMASGESQWITGPMARQDVQRLRARSDALLTGVSTVLIDDPSLTVRLSAEELGVTGTLRQPLRVVLDSRMRLSATAKLLGLPGSTLVITAVDHRPDFDTGPDAQVELLRLPSRRERLDLEAVVTELGRRELGEVQVEAGPTLVGALLQCGLVDEIVVYLAPHLMGAGGRGFAELPGLERMDDRLPLEIMDVRSVGRDLRVTARPAKTGNEDS